MRRGHAHEAASAGGGGPSQFGVARVHGSDKPRRLLRFRKQCYRYRMSASRESEQAADFPTCLYAQLIRVGRVTLFDRSICEVRGRC